VGPDPIARPRLLILTPDYPPTHGGVQVLVHRLAQTMSGFQTEVLTLRSPRARQFDREAEVIIRRVGGRFGSGRTRILELNAAGLMRAARFKPHVMLSAHLVTSPAAAAIRRLRGGRTAQYFYANEIPGKPRLAAFAAAQADVVIAISAYTASLIAATGASTANVRLVAPGVDIPADPAPLPGERPTVLTVAQLKHAYKGHDVLISALSLVRARVPDVEWVVIGEGPLRSDLERLASAAGLAGSARFLGAVSDTERACWLRRADVLAMPSRLPDGRLGGEGFGIAYLEANAYGKPVVAGNVAGALDAVAHGVSGLLVDPTDASAVSDALSRLLLDRELAQRLGREGAARARHFAWSKVAGRVEAILMEGAEANSREMVEAGS
jgi:phosphatidylinositol alpha-1,6-mannosyltransferase